MLNLWMIWLALRADRRGVTAVEYGLIAALIAAVLVTVMGTLGTALTGAFSTVAADL